MVFSKNNNDEQKGKGKMANGDEGTEIKIPHLRLRKTQRLNVFQLQGTDNHQFRIMEKRKLAYETKGQVDF